MELAFGLKVWIAVWTHATITCHLLYLLLRAVLPSRPYLPRRITLATVLPALLTAFLVPEDDTLWRGVVSMASGFYVHRVCEVYYEPSLLALPLPFKVMHVGVSFHDIRLRSKIQNYGRTALKAFTGILFSSCGLVLSGAMVLQLRTSSAIHADEAPIMAMAQRGATVYLRNVAGCMYGMCCLELLGNLLHLLHLLLGIQLPILMDHPMLSTSLKEFWGRRWNSVVQRILRNNVYMPLRKKYELSRTLSALATFIASGCIHIYPLVVAGLPLYNSALMMSFFIVQLGLIQVEDKLFSTSSPAALRRAWTLGCLSLSTMLFTKPLFDLAGL